MKTETINGKTYKLSSDGTYFHVDTPDGVINVLENCRNSRTLVRIFYGDKETGRCWNEEHDVKGYIGRSTGSIKVPLIVHPRSMGGPHLLDHCIMCIKSKEILYLNSKFIRPVVTIVDGNTEYPYTVNIDGESYGRCKTLLSAKRLKSHMSV